MIKTGFLRLNLNLRDESGKASLEKLHWKSFNNVMAMALDYSVETQMDTEYN